MIRNLFLVLMMVNLIGCSSNNDESYYRKNPQALQFAMKTCSNAQGDQLDCKQLDQLGMHIRDLAYQLQRNPQRFGGKILKIQERLADQEHILQTIPDQTKLATLQHQIKASQKELADHLAIVRWLESPKG